MEPSKDDLQRRLLEALSGVGGWSHAAEAWELHEAARLWPGDGPVRAVEIGSFHGRTTIALALGVAARPEAGEVFAVDPHAREGQLDTFLANLEAAGIRKLVTPLCTTSHEARSSVTPSSVHVLFVDGAHSYANVIEDIRDWTPRLVTGGIAAFNDPWLPGVNKALLETACRRRAPFRNARWSVNTIFFNVVTDRRWAIGDSWRALRLRLFLVLGRWWKRIHERLEEDRRIPGRVRRAVARSEASMIRPLFRRLLPLAATACDWSGRSRP